MTQKIPKEDINLDLSDFRSKLELIIWMYSKSPQFKSFLEKNNKIDLVSELDSFSFSDKDISLCLGITEGSVRAHKSNIKSKGE